jgi:glucose/arabinose dehydrogenase
MARLLILLALTSLLSSSLTSEAKISTTLIASGFKKAVWAESPQGAKDHLWVVEKEGTIRILDLRGGKKHDFLDISDRIKIKMNEQGLLGLALEKNYLTSGRFYVYYTNTKGDTEICRFTAHGKNKRHCDPTTRELLLTIKQDYKNHNGGWLGIGPDNYLYIGTGDGGAGNDPKNHGQDLSSHLGKLLRIDVSPEKGYRIPADNPFKNNATAKPEIYAYGLRNPWRCSWDRKTGDFYIADVGQNHWEEINFMPAGKGKGANYGWRLREGDVATPAKKIGGAKPKGSIDPIYVYKHGSGPREGASVTGGYVYRGPIKPLQGKYFFADFANPRIWSFEVKNGKATNFEDWTDRLKPRNGAINTIASFAEDNAGNLLVISHGGSIWQVVEE